MRIQLQHQLQPSIHLQIVDAESSFIFHETTFKFVICNNWKVYEIHFINFNFIKNVYFLPDGKIKLHKHCQQVESSDVFIPTTEASKPVYNFVTDV